MPPLIQAASKSRSLVLKAVPSGGMKGSSFFAQVVQRRLLSTLPGIHNGTAAAAGHEGAEAGEIEIALLLVRVVAGEAFVLQQGRMWS
jgi:hypothetical protein